MARGIEGGRPGIGGLLRLLEDQEYEGALQADLLDRGYSLDDVGRTLSWWDILCVIRWLPPHSAVCRLRDAASWQWGLTEHLLAGIYDGIQGGNWQRGGNKNAPRPKPLPRPGTGKKKRQRAASPGTVAVPVTDIRSEIERRRAQYLTAQPDQVHIAEPVAATPVKSRRLSEDEVRASRKMGAHGIDIEVIAAHLTVPVPTVERLLAGETYRHIT